MRKGGDILGAFGKRGRRGIYELPIMMIEMFWGGKCVYFK